MVEQRHPKIEKFDDGILIDFGGSPYDVEYHDAMVQIWRDERGNIVAIDITYSEGDGNGRTD